MDKDRSAIATAARTGLTRVVIERVAEHMRRRTSVPRLLRRMTMPKAA
jgi:hypothetical protein